MTLPNLTQKQKDIVDTVFLHRFINRAQLQKVFTHKDSKRINVWLKDLVEKNYLGRIYSKKFFENTKPAIYYLSLNGIRYIRQEKIPKRLRKNNPVLRNLYFEKKKSETFINHNLYISELYANLAKDNFYIVKDEDFKFKFYTFSFTTRQRLLLKNGFKDHKEIIPDVYLRIPDVLSKTKPKKGSKTNDNKSYFLNLFDYHVPQYALKHRVDQIIEFYDYEFSKVKAEMNIGGFPTILFIFINPKRIKKIRTYIHHKLEMEGDLGNITFLLTTSKELEYKGFNDSSIWKTIRTDEDW